MRRFEIQWHSQENIAEWFLAYERHGYTFKIAPKWLQVSQYCDGPGRIAMAGVKGSSSGLAPAECRSQINIWQRLNNF